MNNQVEWGGGGQLKARERRFLHAVTRDPVKDSHNSRFVSRMTSYLPHLTP